MWATAAEMNASKVHCPRQHPYDEVNTYVNPAGKRECRACHRARQAEYLKRQARVINAESTGRGSKPASDQRKVL